MKEKWEPTMQLRFYRKDDPDDYPTAPELQQAHINSHTQELGWFPVETVCEITKSPRAPVGLGKEISQQKGARKKR